MRVRIGPYRDWIGPYQIAQKLLFWLDRDHDLVDRFGGWLASNRDGSDSRLHRLCEYIHARKKQHVKIKLDPYDTWSMDSTLSLIVLPMLRQLQKTKHGAPFVDDEDVPDHLRSTVALPKKNEWDTDSNHFARWDWIMDELIWTFEQLQPDNDWEAQYHSGVINHEWVESDHTYPNPVTGEPEKLFEMKKGPNHTHEFDKEGFQKHEERISNGLRLFGKYYRGLWD